jgi:aldehyde dehydrogenase (NAD+)
MAASDPADWPSADVRVRLAWLARFRALIVRDQAALIDLITAETHKPPHEALTGDLLPLLAACRWHERSARRLLAPRRARGGGPLFMGTSARVRRAPLGRVAIIATWNYPVQLLGIQLVQALVAGNRVVVKPSEHAPRTQAHLIALAQTAGLPPGTLDITPATRQAGRELLAAGGIDHVIFTGSTRVGREIAAWAAEHLVPTTLELSGCDSALVLADADVHLAARTIHAAVVMNAGQTCMAPRRVIVEQPAYAAFVDALRPLAAGARPLRLIDAGPAQAAFALVRDALAAGGRNLSGVLEAPRGQWLTPAFIADCPPDAALLVGDHFAPVVAIVPVPDRAAAIAMHTRFNQHLATAVFTRRPAQVGDFATALGSSFVTVNDALLPQAHAGTSLAGRGPSGWGVSRGPDGLLALTRPVCVSVTSPMIRPPVEPPTAKALAQLRSVISWLYRGPTAGSLPPAPPVPTQPTPPALAHKPAPIDPRDIPAPAHAPPSEASIKTLPAGLARPLAAGPGRSST